MSDKTNYFFILGRYPDLSLAELKNVFASQSLPFKLLQVSSQVALVESTQINPEKMNKILGGIVKFGVVVESLPLSSVPDLPLLFTSEVLKNQFFDSDLKKIEFGLSIYSCGSKDVDFQNVRKIHNEITLKIKENMERSGIKSHFPQIRDTVLSSASVDKNKLLKKGAEIVLIVTQDSILVGKTQAVQEFESFSKRDFGRPVRDMKSGVLPPKLARMMINISQVSKNSVLLDPFCGSGTMLQEALQLGYRKIVGTDISVKAVKDSKTNIKWYQQKFNTVEDDSEVTIKRVDATRLSSEIKKESVGGIVTEPYLGPTLSKRLKSHEIDRTINELSKLYINAVKEFYKVLNSNGSVVMVLPVFQSNKLGFMPILEKIEKSGFEIIQLSGSKRKTVIVGNKRDFVLREIIKFVKV